MSAYLDHELIGEEMLAIRAHLEGCSLCRAEYQSLSDTKRLLASLALQTPRAELEDLLLSDAERAARPALARLLPDWLWERFHAARDSATAHPAFWQTEDAEPAYRPRPDRRVASVPAAAHSPLRLRPLAATALLSLAGLWLATASLNGPSDEAPETISPEVALGFPAVPSGGPAPVGVLRVGMPAVASAAPLPPPSVLPLRDPTPLAWRGQDAGTPAFLLTTHRINASTVSSAMFGGGGSAFQLASHR